MLEQMRQNSRNIVIYVLFGILIVVFVLSFGPQAGQQSAGCMPQTSYSVKVGSQPVAESSWRFVTNWILPQLGATSPSSERARQYRVREMVMDGLIERELLAQAAAADGFTLSTEEVQERIAKGEYYVIGQRQTLVDENTKFDYARLERYAQQLGLGSVDGFIAEQKREMLAQKYRELLLGSVRVSPEEVLDKYQREHSSVSIEFVKFEARKYRKELALTDADVTAYLAAHDKEIKEQYERDKNLYSGGGKWVQVRQILVKSERPAAAPAPVEPAPEAKDGGVAPAAPAKPAVDLPDPAKASANAALSRIKGGEDFAAVARSVSKDERTAPRGGLDDWGRLSSLGWGPEVTKLVETLEIGKTSDVLDVPGGYLIVRVEGRTDADPSYDQIKADLAYPLAADAKAKEQAKKDADESFAKAKAGTALDAMFEKGDDTPEDDADEAAEAPAPEAAPVDPTKPAEAAKVAPKGAPRPPATPAVAKSTVAKLLQSGPIHRSGDTVKGNGPTGYVGKSAELAKAIFEQVAVGQLAPQVFEVEDGYVIFKVVAKEEPDMAEFEKEKATLAQDLARTKGYGLLSSWTRQRCAETKSAGAISVNSTYVDYGDVDEKTGKAKPVSYQPCSVAGGLIR